MVLDLEHELLRAAQAFCAWRDHVRRDSAEAGFTCADLLEFIEQTSAESAFPRISHRLVAHILDGLAESLARIGFFERVSAGLYRLTETAVAYLYREPVSVAQDQWLPGTIELPFRRKDR